MLLGGCEKPQWSQASSRPTDLCYFVAFSDYVVKVTPGSIDAPKKIQMSPWPDYPFWVTPVRWSVDDLVLTLPVSGQTLQPLRGTIDTIIPAPFTDKQSSRYVSIVDIDGQLWVDPHISFFFDGKSWVREEDQDPSTAKYAFANEADLKRAFQQAASRAACSRVNWVEDTRVASQKAQAEAKNNPPNTQPALVTDAGGP